MRVALACALLAVLLGAVVAWLQASGSDNHVTALVHMSALDPTAGSARAADPHFAFVPETSHYDGTYFWAIARDPLARGTQHLQIDDASYRYGHALLGELAAVISLGNGGSVAYDLLIINLLSLGAGAFLASRLAAGTGRTPWAGLVVGLSPGLLYATSVDTSEPLSAALLAAALLAWQRRRLLPCGIVLTLLALSKEPLALTPFGLAAGEIAVLWRAGGTARVRAVLTDPARRPFLRRAMVALAVGPLIFVAWLTYLRHVFGVWPTSEGDDRLGRPLAGWWHSMRLDASYGVGDFVTSQVGEAGLPLLLAALALLLVGLVAALRHRRPLDGVYTAVTLLLLCVGPIAVEYPKDLLRITVIPLLLLPAVLTPPAGFRSPAGAGGDDDRPAAGRTAGPSPDTPHSR